MLLAQSKWENVEMANLADLLEATRPERTLGTDYRGFEWYYWHRLCHTALATFPFDRAAYSVRFSPAGKWWSVGGEERKITILETAGGPTTPEFSGHGGPIWGLSF